MPDHSSGALSLVLTIFGAGAGAALALLALQAL